MNRRVFIGALAGGLLAAPFAAEGQQGGKVYRVGYLLPNATRPTTEEFWAGLRELGYIETQNVTIERRYADGKPQRYPALAAELVRLRVDVIVADGAEATRAARQATTTIPIVMIAAAPVELGLIKKLNRPGGNVTGLSTNAPNLIGKRVELLKEVLPTASRIAVLANAENPAGAFFLTEAERIGRSVGLQVRSLPVRPGSDLDATLERMTNGHPDAMLLIEDPTLMSANTARIAHFALRHRLPTMGGSIPYAEGGIFMTYGPNYPAMYRRTAFYVDKILKGVRPADLPVEEPTKFDLVFNLKTAKALGLTIPPSLLQRADQVIE